jgi:hypothetical protein
LSLAPDGKTLLGHVDEWRAANNMTGAGVDPTSAYYQGAWVSLHYSLIAPDDRVEWDLFTYPDEVNAAPFLAAFQPAAEALGDRALFTPHYRIVDGDSHGWSPAATATAAATESLTAEPIEAGWILRFFVRLADFLCSVVLFFSFFFTALSTSARSARRTTRVLCRAAPSAATADGQTHRSHSRRRRGQLCPSPLPTARPPVWRCAVHVPG